MPAWLNQYSFDNFAGARIADAIAYLQQEAGVESISSYGYCWGGYLGAAQSASDNPVIKGHVSFHPSWAAENTLHGPGSVEKLAERITVPQLLLSAGNDPDFVREGGSVEKILKAKADIGELSDVVDFPDVIHGWVNRGDLQDPTTKAAVMKAWHAAVKFTQTVNPLILYAPVYLYLEIQVTGYPLCQDAQSWTPATMHNDQLVVHRDRVHFLATMVNVIEPNVHVPNESPLDQMGRAIAAVERKEMLIRGMKIIVDETNIVGVAAKAFREALTRAHLVDAFGMTARSGDNVDQVRVESMNHWIMEERVMHKKPKRDINAHICIAGAESKEAKCIAKAQDKDDRRVAIAEAKEAIRIANVHTKESKKDGNRSGSSGHPNATYKYEPQ
ncbi:hypothetical protein ON010_g17221 [Phytophthora cinnamomi]|nr:hypothetical protein ON010_g17221 [Phytophthora cinnamomi]